MEKEEISSQKELPNEWRIWHELSGLGPTDDLKSFKKFDLFLSEYKTLVQPNKLQDGASLHCFLANFDRTYAEGYWTKRFRLSDADNVWKNTVLAVLEEKCYPHEHVLGARADMRGKFVDITLWTKEAGAKNVQLRIAKDWKSYTRYDFLMGYALASGRVYDKIPNEKYIYTTSKGSRASEKLNNGNA